MKNKPLKTVIHVIATDEEEREPRDNRFQGVTLANPPFFCF